MKHYLDRSPFVMMEQYLEANQYGHIGVAQGGKSVKVAVSLPVSFLENQLREMFGH